MRIHATSGKPHPAAITALIVALIAIACAVLTPEHPHQRSFPASSEAALAPAENDPPQLYAATPTLAKPRLRSSLCTAAPLADIGHVPLLTFREVTAHHRPCGEIQGRAPPLGTRF